MKRLFGKKGFTLVEIVIVIVLLAILAAVAYPRYLDLRDDAHRAVDQAVIGSWRSGVHIFFAKNKRFPGTETELLGCLDGGVPTGWEVEWNENTPTATITCNGLPSTGATQSWTYNSEDGSFTPDSDEHESDS